MALRQMNRIIAHLRETVLARGGASLTDAQLLECFIAGHEEAAFEAIVRRHGPMVLSVCQRILRNSHDAEDAFQATFLVLARKASSIRSRELVANWLYGVACQTALKARTALSKRQARERTMNEMPEAEAVRQDGLQDWLPLLDQQMSSLPEKYRSPIVLCDLEGKTRREAARQLGLQVGTLSSRLARGRILLAKRLARHGVVFSGGTIATILLQNAASACVPASLISSTVKAATALVGGKALAATIVSAKVAVLTEGVLRAMLISKLRIAVTVVLVLSAVALTLGVIAGQQDVKAKPQITPAEPPKEGAKEAKAFGIPAAKKPAENKKSRVLLFAGGPVREYQFVRGLFLGELKQKRMELSTLLQQGDEAADVEGALSLTEFPDQLGSDASKKKGTSLSDYDVIIAFDPDWSQLSKAQQVNLEKWVAEHKGGILFVAGPVHTHQLAKLALQKLVPVVLKDRRLVEFDNSRPYALQVAPKTTIKLGPIDEAPTAAWNRYFWDDEKFKPDPDQPQEPKRGFYTCYPAEKLRPAAQTLLSFVGPKELRINDGKTDPPYLASMAYGTGTTMFLGSAETWRLRAYNSNYHERFWLQLVHELTAKGPAKK